MNKNKKTMIKDEMIEELKKIESDNSLIDNKNLINDLYWNVDIKIKDLLSILKLKNRKELMKFIKSKKIIEYCKGCKEQLVYTINNRTNLKRYKEKANSEVLGLDYENLEYPHLCEECYYQILTNIVTEKLDLYERKKEIKNQKKIEAERYKKMHTKDYYQTEYWRNLCKIILQSIKKCERCSANNDLEVVSVDTEARGMEEPIKDYSKEDILILYIEITMKLLDILGFKYCVFLVAKLIT